MASANQAVGFAGSALDVHGDVSGVTVAFAAILSKGKGISKRTSYQHKLELVSYLISPATAVKGGVAFFLGGAGRETYLARTWWAVLLLPLRFQNEKSSGAWGDIKARMLGSKDTSCV